MCVMLGSVLKVAACVIIVVLDCAKGGTIHPSSSWASEGDVRVEAVNAVLAASPQQGDFVVVIKDNNSELSVHDVSSARGVGVLEVAAQEVNITHTQLVHLLNQARQMYQWSSSVVVVMVSDSPVVMSALASLSARHLGWSTRLMILTNIPLQDLHHIRNTLAMTNSLLVVLTLTPNKQYRSTVYVEMPYAPPNSLPLVVGTWTQGKGFTTKLHIPLYPDKFYKLWWGPGLRVVRTFYPSDKRVTLADPSAPGGTREEVLSAQNTLMQDIAVAMNFTCNFFVAEEDWFGSQRPDGSWSGMVGVLSREEADIGIGLFTITEQRNTAMDFTALVTIFNLRILAGRGRGEVDPWGFLLPLGPLVWGTLLVALLGVQALTTIFLFCLNNNTKIFATPLASMPNSLRILLQQDLNKGGGFGWWGWERVLLGVWMLTTLVLTRSYSGNLMSLLAIRYIGQPLQSLEDVVDSPVNVLLYKGTAQTQSFQVATSGVFYDVWQLGDENRLRVFRGSIGINQMLREGEAVYLVLDIFARRRMASDFTNTGRCDFYLGREKYLTSKVAMAGPKRSPLIAALSRRLLEAAGAGLYDNYERTYHQNFSYCHRAPTKITVRTTLTVTNLWGTLVVVAGGAAVSALVFCMELALFYFYNTSLFQDLSTW